jgi:hypothetical protein
MKKSVVSTVGIFVLLLSACGSASTLDSNSNSNSPSASSPSTPTSTLQPNQPQTQTTPNTNLPSSWHSYSSDAGRYSVAFPDKPTERTQDLPVPTGTVKQFITLTGNNDGAFFVAYNDIPKGISQQDPQGILAEAVKVANKQLKGKIKEDRITALDEFPCRSYIFEDVRVSGIEAIATGRTCLVKDRLYQQLVLGNKSKITNADIDQFIQSFKLAK